MITHYIIMSSSYSKGKRIALDNIVDQKDYLKLKEIIQDENIEKEKIRQIMKKIVPTYHEPEEVNTSIKNSRKELGEKAKRKQTKAEVATA